MKNKLPEIIYKFSPIVNGFDVDTFGKDSLEAFARKTAEKYARQYRVNHTDFVAKNKRKFKRNGYVIVRDYVYVNVTLNEYGSWITVSSAVKTSHFTETKEYMTTKKDYVGSDNTYEENDIGESIEKYIDELVYPKKEPKYSLRKYIVHTLESRGMVFVSGLLLLCSLLLWIEMVI